MHKSLIQSKSFVKRIYINMNTELIKKAKDDSEKHFFNYWIMQFLEKQCKMWQNRDIKLVTTKQEDIM